MDYTFPNAHPSRIPSPAPVLSTFDLDALKRRTSLIQTTANKCLDDNPWLQKEVAKDVLIELIKNRNLWIFIEGDEEYYLTDDPTMDSEEEWQLSPQDVDTVKQMLEPDEALLPQASQTTPAMRIGMIIWLVITSLAVQDYHEEESAWDKWDVQGRTITIWADLFSEILHSKKRPSEAIPTDDDAMAAFKSAMDIAGHQHDYQEIPELGAWVTMHAALSPELKGSELACWHFNDADGCSLCDERFREKLQSETGFDYMPPLHLVALWEHFDQCEDFEERIVSAVIQRPHLFSPEVMKPAQGLLAERYPEKARRAFALHYKRYKHDTIVRNWGSGGPSWDKIQDIIDSLRHFAPSCRDRSFPPIEPIFWFDMVRVLGGQYQSQDKGKEANWRPRVSLAAAYNLDDKILGEEFPPLNLDLLPKYVQRAVKQFCQATECEEHNCDIYIDNSDSWQTWGQLAVKYRTRYAATYALLYSTDIVPLLGNDDEICDACNDIRALYDCVDAISAGQITLGSKNIAKVLGLIKELAVISDDCKFTFPDDRSDVDDFEESSESSQRPDDQQRGGNSNDEEVMYDQTHDRATVVDNAGNTFDTPTFTEREASESGWKEHPSATQIYEFTREAPVFEYTTMLEGHTNLHDAHELTNLQWGPPAGDSEHLPFGGAFPDSLLGEVMGSHVPATSWSTEQPPEFMTTSNAAVPSRPKDNVGPKISKEAKKRELHAFFVTLFKTHGVPLGTTGMAEARLPWKKMTSVLADQGLEVVGWPDRVPKPRSDGKADKGISGFNTEHIGALYQAMKAGKIEFRPLAGGSPTNDASRVRQREDDMEEEVNMRPTKKRKLAETRKKPKDFVAMQSVIKF
ncbi:hypothetical protein C8R44DRAFT_992990 [Mycena epipterygia]|nr:hypothetical protein C8R44DRAFT_992990 [Mycena epipterygia]